MQSMGIAVITNSKPPSRPGSNAVAPCIFNYLDYREFLKDYYEFRKSGPHSYSYASFSLRARLKSPNYLKLVTTGTRNLTSDKTLRFAQALGLNEYETIYWENLVAYNQSKTSEEKRHYFMKLAHSPASASGDPAGKIREIRDEWEYLTRWHHAAIRELVLLPSFQPDPNWVADELMNRISPAEAKESLLLLERLQFVEVDAEGNWRQSQKQIRYYSAQDIQNIAVQDFHRSTGELALSSLKEDEPSERDFSGLMVAISASNFDEIKKKITQFRQMLNEELSQKTKATPDWVVHINFQVIPVSRGPRRKRVLSGGP